MRAAVTRAHTPVLQAGQVLAFSALVSTSSASSALFRTCCLTCWSKDLLDMPEQRLAWRVGAKNLLDTLEHMLEQRLAGRARWSICGCGQATADGAFPSKLATAAFAARWISLAS